MLKIDAVKNVLITCEHASFDIPKEQRHLFRGRERFLRSHRGWDFGALPVAQSLGDYFGAKVFAGSYSRLLVDLNRPAEFAASREVLKKYHTPHWRAVQRDVERLSPVIHIAVHSFTPVLRGEKRKADIGLLFDPRRASEAVFCDKWQRLLQRKSDWCIRKNSPYKGTGQGLAKELRKTFSPRQYIGIELEMNQKILKTSSGLSKMKILLNETLEFLLTEG